MDTNSHIGHRKRLRERIETNGFETLFPHELLEYILFGAITQGDTNVLAHRLISTFGSIEKVFLAEREELLKVKGVGSSTATLIKSYQYIANMLEKTKTTPHKKLSTLGQLRSYFYTFFKGKFKEEFHVLLLTKDFVIIKHIITSSPMVDKVVVDMNDVIKSIAQEKPYAVIFAHNHPSGVVTPTVADIEFTKRYFGALYLAFNIVLAEHMIFNSVGDCYSFKNGGELNSIKEIVEKQNNTYIKDNINLGGFNE